MPTVEQVRQLPIYFQQAIPNDYLDRMGHMNIQYYLRLYDAAAQNMFVGIGMTDAYIEETTTGAFALEQHLRYWAEIHAGADVSVHLRVVGLSPKRVQFMGFIVNETTNQVAGMFENVGSHADLAARRTTPFPPHLAANFATLLAEHQQLAWEPPFCGAIRV